MDLTEEQIELMFSQIVLDTEIQNNPPPKEHEEKYFDPDFAKEWDAMNPVPFTEGNEVINKKTDKPPIDPDEWEEV